MKKSFTKKQIKLLKVQIPDYEDVGARIVCFGKTVPIRGVRLYQKEGWPNLVQVMIGKRWITVIQGPRAESRLYDHQVTARAIREMILRIDRHLSKKPTKRRKMV